MSGCDWEKKSFSVAVTDKRSILCKECNQEAKAVYKYNGDYLCKECFLKKPSKNSFGNINTHKDLAYNFTTEVFDGKPVVIRSKRQYRTLLKQHGMADASIKECRQEAEFRKRLNNEDRPREINKTAERIFEKNRELLKFRRR